MRTVLFFLFLLMPGISFAFHLGPATPAAGHGQVNAGAGYYFHQAEWESVDIEQNRGYLHLGYGMGMLDEPLWEVYARAGAADLEDESGDFDADFEPFGGLGLKGSFWDGKPFGWGMVVQGAYFAGFSSGEVEINDYWELEAGFPIQARFGPVIIYGGPLFYHAEADGQNGTGPEMKLREDLDFGGFGGLGFDFGRVRLEAEAQYRSEFSAGGFISFRY